MTVQLEITALGAQGDGVARGERGPVYVPFTLPGEIVNAAVERDRGTLMAVLSPSAQRVKPPCRHFGDCGGCSLQHLEASAYRSWKRERVVEALAGRGIQVRVEDLIPCPPASRRRVSLAARVESGTVTLGYNAALSHRIVDIVECPIAAPEIVTALPMLRRLARLASPSQKPFRIHVTATASGLDVVLMDCGRPGEAVRRHLAAFAITEKLARLSIDGELVVEPHKPIIMVGDAVVAPPAGGFLQAVASAEAAMGALVADHLSRAKKTADLFAGVGTFALRLAKTGDVHAVEGDAAALAALDKGFRGAAGLRRVTVERRDLFVRPLTWKELSVFDGLVFDPPRAGAEEQAIQIARSTVQRVAAVSCNPVTLARDLRILIDGGYVLKSVTPVDQFLWSPHVEAVALMEKPRKRR